MLEALAIIILLPFAAASVIWLLGLVFSAVLTPFAATAEWLEENVNGNTVLLLVALFGAYCVVHSMIVSWP
jgi:hypothetical protein